MTAHKDLLLTTIGDEPPSRLDLDQLIRGSRRRARRRTLAGVAGCGAATAAVVVVAAAIVAPAPAPVAPPESPRALAVPAAVAELAPDVVWLSSPAWKSETGSGSYTGIGLLRNGRRVGTLSLEITARGAPLACPTGTRRGIECSLSADGRYRELSEIFVDSAPTARITVDLVRADGDQVRLTTNNWTDLAGTDVTGDLPPLTGEELTILAVQPELDTFRGQGAP